MIRSYQRMVVMWEAFNQHPCSSPWTRLQMQKSISAQQPFLSPPTFQQGVSDTMHYSLTQTTIIRTGFLYFYTGCNMLNQRVGKMHSRVSHAFELNLEAWTWNFQTFTFQYGLGSGEIITAWQNLSPSLTARPMKDKMTRGQKLQTFEIVTLQSRFGSQGKIPQVTRDTWALDIFTQELT